MSAQENMAILSLVADYGLPRWSAVASLRLAKSTCYRWPGRRVEGSLEDGKGGSPSAWNRLSPEEAWKAGWRLVIRPLAAPYEPSPRSP